MDSQWPDGTPRSQNNAFTNHGFTPLPTDWAKDRTINGTADSIARKSAATKRANGQDLMPRLHLAGSKFPKGGA